MAVHVDDLGSINIKEQRTTKTSPKNHFSSMYKLNASQAYLVQCFWVLKINNSIIVVA